MITTIFKAFIVFVFDCYDQWKYDMVQLLMLYMLLMNINMEKEKRSSLPNSERKNLNFKMA